MAWQAKLLKQLDVPGVTGWDQYEMIDTNTLENVLDTAIELG